MMTVVTGCPSSSTRWRELARRSATDPGRQIHNDEACLFKGVDHQGLGHNADGHNASQVRSVWGSTAA